MREDRERLLDILEAIERVEKFSVKGRQAFEEDELVQAWIVHNLIHQSAIINLFNVFRRFPDRACGLSSGSRGV